MVGICTPTCRSLKLLWPTFFLCRPRRWDHLVQKPLAVTAYSLSLRQGQDLLRSVGMSPALIERVFDAFARRRLQSSSWSRVLDEAPERRMDALELFSGLALTCRATTKEKLSILFYLFDSGEMGAITEDDLGAMLSSCASVLRNLGLCLPVSPDEAAFVAGTAFGQQQRAATGSAAAGDCHNYGLAYGVDEIDLPAFLTWAQRAEVPGRALELLALPHRFSRLVDLIASKACTVLPERYLPGNGQLGVPMENRPAGRKRAWGCTSKEAFARRKLPAQRRIRANAFPSLPKGEGSFGSRTFALHPYLCGVGPHSANVMLEIGPGSHSTAGYSAWGVVVSVEELCGSRFCFVDSQPLGLSVGEPGYILLSCLRAATDHRLTISWDAAAEPRKSGSAVGNFSGSHHAEDSCRTLRFTTLPADALVVGDVSASGTDDAPSSNQEPASKRQGLIQAGGRCIKFASMSGGRFTQDVCRQNDDDLLQPHPTKSSTGEPARRRGVSVVVTYGQQTSLATAENNCGRGPWWNTTAERPAESPSTTDQISPDALVQSWPLPMAMPNHKHTASPATTEPERSPRGSGFAPFCGEAVERNGFPSTGNARDLPGGGDPESGDVDIMLHLSPDWRAVEAVRRCFHVLARYRLESPAVRQDGRRMVSNELRSCVRSLLTKCFRERRGVRGNRARKCCAHVILGGLQNPWLGLDEVRGCDV